jgi:hypothetical protein
VWNRSKLPDKVVFVDVSVATALFSFGRGLNECEGPVLLPVSTRVYHNWSK